MYKTQLGAESAEAWDPDANWRGRNTCRTTLVVAAALVNARDGVARLNDNPMRSAALCRGCQYKQQKLAERRGLKECLGRLMLVQDYRLGQPVVSLGLRAKKPEIGTALYCIYICSSLYSRVVESLCRCAQRTR
jgi:hypothetical protein